MNWKQWIKRAARPLLHRWRAAPSAPSVAPPPTISVEQLAFNLSVLAAARGIAATGDASVILPTDSIRPKPRPHELKIGFVGNLANNAYNFVKCMRRLGYDAELVVEDGALDAFALGRPFWEDVPAECGSYEEALTFEARWSQPACVRRVKFDHDLQARFQGNSSAIPEVQAMFKQDFGRDLAADRALVLAQQMGHWPLVLALKRYDVVQLSAAGIGLGAFCPRPYIAFPTGSDLFLAPFEDSVFGLLMRGGYRGAGCVVAGEPNYPDYLSRIGVTDTCTYLPAMIDTDTYSPGPADEIRERWAREVGGDRFLLGVCRQSWEWKGSDRLIRAFADFFRAGGSRWRLILCAWGIDIDKSKALIHDLGISDSVLWLPLCSKPTLRERQRAADAVADQFVMGGYGMSVMECLAAGKPVMIAPVEKADEHFFSDVQPPFVGARTVPEIVAAMHALNDDRFRRERGNASRRWIEDVHGYPRIAPRLVEILFDVMNGTFSRSRAGSHASAHSDAATPRLAG